MAHNKSKQLTIRNAIRIKLSENKMPQQTTSNVPVELEGTVFEIMLKEHAKPNVPQKCIWKQAREAKEFLEARGFK